MGHHHAAQIAYDGLPFLGWQKNGDGPSIEEVLEKVCYQIFQEPIFFRAASRTDRGVHALFQIVDFSTTQPITNYHAFIISLNSLLPSEIRCLSATKAPENFHPTLSALNKSYQYSISTGSVQPPLLRHTYWHVHYPLDMSLFKKAASLFEGTFDFRGLCNQRHGLNETRTVCNVHNITLKESQNEIIVTLKADRFLYKMARNIVGTIVWVARKKIPLSAITSALQSRKRSEAGVTAPAHGLCLIDISYPEPLFVM
jgi:tRNA pseudouridine38-40 synthase